MLASAGREKTRLLLACNFSLSSLSVDCVKRTRELLLSTTERKFGTLPSDAKSLEPYETPDGRVRVIADQGEPDVWAIRYSEPDSTRPGRDWIVEGFSASTNGSCQFSLRLSCFSERYDFSFLPSTPGPLKEIVSQLQAHLGGLTLSPTVQIIGDDTSLEKVKKELEHVERWWNTIIISESSNPDRGIEMEKLQRNLLGCANIYFLPEKLEAEFVDLFGHEHRIYGGAARSFRPRFRIGETQGAANPVISAPWKSSEFHLERALHILSIDAFETSTKRISLNREAPGFADVRQYIASRRLIVAPSSGRAPSIEQLEEALAATQEEVEIAQSLGAQAENERRQVEDENGDLKARNAALASRISALEAALESKGISSQTPNPTRYDGFSDWVSKNFSGRLSLHPRAQRALKDAEYEDIDVVSEAVRILAMDYVNMRRGEAEQSKVLDALSAYGISLGPSITPSRLGETGDEYIVMHKGRKQTLEMHLKKGTSREPRHQLRVYFFFDEEDGEVVVGWLPSHLKTRIT
jgi:hypothetical protein